MEQLAEQVQEVINHFKIVKYIGLGVGLGANLLTRHALAYPERVECLMLVNTVITKAGWVEWGYQKRNISHLRTTGITQTVQEYLLWHHLGRVEHSLSCSEIHMKTLHVTDPYAIKTQRKARNALRFGALGALSCVFMV